MLVLQKQPSMFSNMSELEGMIEPEVFGGESVDGTQVTMTFSCEDMGSGIGKVGEARGILIRGGGDRVMLNLLVAMTGWPQGQIQAWGKNMRAEDIAVSSTSKAFEDDSLDWPGMPVWLRRNFSTSTNTNTSTSTSFRRLHQESVTSTMKTSGIKLATETRKVVPLWIIPTHTHHTLPPQSPLPPPYPPDGWK
jgi:hypothetical protein